MDNKSKDDPYWIFPELPNPDTLEQSIIDLVSDVSTKASMGRLQYSRRQKSVTEHSGRDRLRSSTGQTRERTDN